ncbi:hypothetical protein NQ317_019945 [Molorchus minor]|uniref:Integrase catalytic domain-containing protein n=1 Tax=Molorchus minor TaxID=1323400 RepID=A0ABQ9JC36_9CUCU|nr:hypothetical protein NQ317_019945 [Molorchus minor]
MSIEAKNVIIREAYQKLVVRGPLDRKPSCWVAILPSGAFTASGILRFEPTKYKKENTIPDTKNVKIIKGDLFTAPDDYSLVYCVSKDFKMEKGITNEFKNTFGGVDQLRNQGKEVGEVARLRLTGRNIYYLSYENAWNALRNLGRECDENEERVLALPQIELYVNVVEHDVIVPIWDKDVIKHAQEQDDYCKVVKAQLHDEEDETEERYYIDNEGILPWELTSMDIVGPLVISHKGNRYQLTLQDYFTKYPEAIPIPDQKAETVAKASVKKVIVRHGAPEKLLTDRGAIKNI